MSALKRATLYLRVSDDGQGKEKSIKDQLTEAKAFAARDGIEIMDDLVYIDDGITGRSTEIRPALQRMLADIESGRLKALGVSVLLCWGIDRMGRNLRQSLNTQHLLMQNGIKLISIKEGYRTEDSGENKMQFAIEALIAESYSETLAHLGRRAHKAAALKGKYRAPKPPFGYRRCKDMLVVEPREAQIVRDVFRLFLGGLSRRSIARLLKERKNAKRNGNIEWSIDEITRMLCSDALIGIRVYMGVVWDGKRNVPKKETENWIVTPNAHEPVITLDDFVRAQKLIRERNANMNFNAVRRHFSLLGGLNILVCGKCGGSYSSNIGPGFKLIKGQKIKTLWRSYLCGRRQRLRDCDNHSLQQSLLDGIVLRRIAAYVRAPEAVGRKWEQFRRAGIEKLLPLKDKLKAIEGEIAQLEQKEARIMDAYGTGDMTKDLFKKYLEDTSQKLQATREQRWSIKKRFAVFEKNFDEGEHVTKLEEFHLQFGALPPESRKMLIKQLIKKVTINGPREFVIETTFLPEPIQFPFGEDYEPAEATTGEPGERR